MVGTNKNLISTRQLSEATGLSVYTINKAVMAGKLPCLRLGRRILFDLDLVRRHMDRIATARLAKASARYE